MQNTTHAVMAQRSEPLDSADDFPPQPWATRALVEHILEDHRSLRKKNCLEPACGAGHMAKVLGEYFRSVDASDANVYGFGEVRDFLSHPFPEQSVDWVITNPLSSSARNSSLVLWISPVKAWRSLLARSSLKASDATTGSLNTPRRQNSRSSRSACPWWRGASIGRQ